MECSVTETEVLAAKQDMKEGKHPGHHGFSLLYS